ncbi:efflux RND transporter periplasmic adaptor subunit [Flavobacteriaceae bacterium S0825]|uniref:efflux RND transporter periplasmic adaptor subunit n=1 Tax=Gaetbulibacter sp. S0825 TaxID=2720084 RepID=UPI00143055B4|nr:efflux RND transporter periplasmic adaptor subunit [Gaetbulibacter sp. S0825]MCK0108693.1 efflux RND transporter periplasmic adaptor subunit [Flavobacteriaceae bacterium S0825]NIX64329.1 efflux RND transporter periplasmic adaptor subunit [Gaetbulibacter sp. S0825]
MKNYISYIIILVIGLFLGWLLFGTANNDENTHNHEVVSETNQMWTCSMHPQIMQQESGSCPICGMDLIPAEINSDGLLANQFKLTDNAMALANIETTTVGVGESATNQLILSGKIQANDKATAVQTAHFGGRIEILNFKSEGEFVNNGTVIASIYSPELVTAQNELIEAMDIKNEQPELYKAVRNKLKFWKISEQQIKQIELTKKVITNFKMYANTKGYIETIFVEEGNHVKEGTPLFKVANLNTVWAQLDVYEQDVRNLSIGQSVLISLNAFPDKNIEGKIDYISPTLNNKTRTISVRATLKNSNGNLKPGMLISATTKLKTNDKGAVSIPKSAVLWTGERSIVYVRVPNDSPVFELREITLGNAVGENYKVLSGLEQGEVIVTNGAFTVDAAAQLNGKQSMMNTITSDADESSKMIERLEVSTTFQEQLKAVVESYLTLKDYLVNDDASNTTMQAKLVLADLDKVDMTLLTNNNAHMQWMGLLKDIKTAASSLAKETDIAMQRNYFKPLSSSITKAVELFGINQTVYLQFCPMADGDKGANWLSLTEEIFNPYFGDAMLKCGSVEQVIK